jgi:MarR family transcriptional regulator, organic hydroperoxide resistance regulator
MSWVTEAIKQTVPFGTTAQEAGIALLLTADKFKRTFEDILEPFEITGQQYNILRILRGAGKNGLPTMEIGDRLIEKSPGLTRLIDRLEKKDLVLRERCETDRRQVFCTITKQGLQLLEKIGGRIAKMEHNALDVLSQRELKELMELLHKIYKNSE